MISAVRETSGLSIDETKPVIDFLKLRSSRKNEKFGQRRIFYLSLFALENIQTNTIIISWKFY